MWRPLEAERDVFLSFRESFTWGEMKRREEEEEREGRIWRLMKKRGERCSWSHRRWRERERRDMELKQGRRDEVAYGREEEKNKKRSAFSRKTRSEQWKKKKQILLSRCLSLSWSLSLSLSIVKRKNKKKNRSFTTHLFWSDSEKERETDRRSCLCFISLFFIEMTRLPVFPLFKRDKHLPKERAIYDEPREACSIYLSILVYYFPSTRRERERAI